MKSTSEITTHQELHAVLLRVLAADRMKLKRNHIKVEIRNIIHSALLVCQSISAQSIISTCCASMSSLYVEPPLPWLPWLLKVWHFLQRTKSGKKRRRASRDIRGRERGPRSNDSSSRSPQLVQPVPCYFQTSCPGHCASCLDVHRRNQLLGVGTQGPCPWRLLECEDPVFADCRPACRYE